jgi:putative drug exporter of the RND superfamily
MTTTTKTRPSPPAAARRWPGWVRPAIVVALFLLVAGPVASAGSKLADVQRNDATAYLPSGAEATGVSGATKRFTGIESTTAIIVYGSPAGISKQDQIDITLVDIQIAQELSAHLAGPPMGPIISDDNQAAEVIVPLIGSDPNRLRGDVDALRAQAAATPGLEMHVAGPAAALTDLTEVFGEVDGVLLLVALGAVLLILVVAYRSPILPFVVLGVAGMALGLANGMVYLLAKQGVLTVSGDAQGILDVLVLGAGTDYALLLTARYRDELRRHRDRYRAMRVAWRAAVQPIAASGATVILGLLCLLASDLGSTRGLGPVAAVGIACALVSMLILLPAVLALVGRWAFWPFRPTFGSPATGERGFWPRLAAGIGRHSRLVWVLTVLALGGLALGMTRLEAHGVPRTESFLAPVDSNAGQDVLSRHFSDATATPVLVVCGYPRLDDVIAAAGTVPGVTKAVAYVDPLEAFDRHKAGQPAPPPKEVAGQGLVSVTIDAAPDSPRATATVQALRDKLHSLPGAGAKVGGYTATNLDLQRTAQRDREVVIPLVLALVLVVLMLLLRAVVAPVILVATVILSFLATLGVSGVFFRDVFGFAGADSSFPLFAFVFLVALGIDYNIFLMSRVREEVARRGHRAGVLTGLAATGGVVSSAGVVLAATFAALAVLPLLVLAELAFAVSVGVLLDALVVRTLLVPALTLDLGRVVWWPGPLRRADP